MCHNNFRRQKRPIQNGLWHNVTISKSKWLYKQLVFALHMNDLHMWDGKFLE